MEFHGSMTKLRPTKDQWKAFFRGESSEDEYVWLHSLLEQGDISKEVEELFLEEKEDVESIAIPYDKEAVFRNVQNQIEVKKIEKPTFKSKFAIAASIIVLFGTWLSYDLFFETKQLVYVSQNMETKEIILPDDSKVVLNANSSLKYSEASGKRRVNLSGEAFFEVKRDTSNPFIITTKDVGVAVLGTSFNVKSYDRVPTVVTVRTGKVKVDFEERNQEVVLIKNEEVALVGKQLYKRSTIDHNIDWITGKLVYHDTPLSTIFEDLSLWYGIEIRASNDIKKIKYTATISLDKDLKDFLRSLEISESINYTMFNSHAELIKE